MVWILSGSRRAALLKIAGLCGVAMPIIVLPLVLLAISYSPWFSWTENALSDLGVHEAAILFNSSLMVGGILFLIFVLGLLQIMRQSRTGLIGTFLSILTAVSLFAIGLFPETAGSIHLYVSISFFAFDALSMLFIGLAFAMQQSARKIGVFSIFAGLFAAAVWIVFWSSQIKGVAIPEALAALTAFAWVVILGIRLFMQA